MTGVCNAVYFRLCISDAYQLLHLLQPRDMMAPITGGMPNVLGLYDKHDPRYRHAKTRVVFSVGP